jgi:hypothetical protein
MTKGALTPLLYSLTPLLYTPLLYTSLHSTLLDVFVNHHDVFGLLVVEFETEAAEGGEHS